jgi:uncharacterized protein (TIGR03437 family)
MLLWMIFIAMVGQLVASANAQDITNIVVTSSAGFHMGIPASGSLASLFCSGLKLTTSVTSTQYPLPFELAGVQIRVGGVMAPLLSASELGGFQQVNFQSPTGWQLSPDLTVEITVSQEGHRGSSRTHALIESPGEFFFVNSNLPAIQHASDYSLVNADKPAKPGELLVAYLTGLGDTEPNVAIGSPSPFNPLAIVPQYQETTRGRVFRIVVDSTAVVPEFVGLTPGIAGVYQINFKLPTDLLAGNHVVRLRRETCKPVFGSCGITTDDSWSLPVNVPVS